MGEYADKIINGECCELCMMPYVHKKDKETVYQHGYPAVCNDCWDDECKGFHTKQSSKATTDYE